MQETRQARVRRLIYRSSYTGMKETDLLLGQFAKLHLPTLDDTDLDHYEALLEAGDPSIFAWVRGDEPIPAEFDTCVLALISDFNKTL